MAFSQSDQEGFTRPRAGGGGHGEIPEGGFRPQGGNGAGAKRWCVLAKSK